MNKADKSVVTRLQHGRKSYLTRVLRPWAVTSRQNLLHVPGSSNGELETRRSRTKGKKAAKEGRKEGRSDGMRSR